MRFPLITYIYSKSGRKSNKKGDGQKNNSRRRKVDYPRISPKIVVCDNFFAIVRQNRRVGPS